MVPLTRGDLLFRIDPRPYQYAVNQRQALLAEAEPNVMQAKTSLDQAMTGVEKAQAQLALAQQTYDRKTTLVVKDAEHWTIHDLRRTATSLLGKFNTPAHLKPLLLTHTNRCVTAYDPFGYLPTKPQSSRTGPTTSSRSWHRKTGLRLADHGSAVVPYLWVCPLTPVMPSDGETNTWFAFLLGIWDTICAAWRFAVIHWKQIDEFIEPNWEKVGTQVPPNLFWRETKQAAVLGYIRDGELFDHKWLYVCDSNKVTHFSEVNGPGSNVVELKSFRPDTEI